MIDIKWVAATANCRSCSIETQGKRRSRKSRRILESVSFCSVNPIQEQSIAIKIITNMMMGMRLIHTFIAAVVLRL